MINKIKKLSLLFISIFLVIIYSFNVFALSHRDWNGDPNTPYQILNGNIPNFSEYDKGRTDFFMEFSELDDLGRVGQCYMNVSKDHLPKDDREPINSVTPTGWKYNKKSTNNKYPGVVSGSYIWNRCHILGFQMSGENANKKNLFTGTRFINVIGQLPFESDVTKYVKKTGNHVLYRVTPIFEGDNLVCEGVIEEGWSVEDNGEGICFNVFCYNVQPGIFIDYKTGQNWLEKNAPDNIKYDDPFYKEENNQNNKSEDKGIVIDEITIEEDEEIGPGVTNNYSTKKSTNKKNNTSTKKSSSKTVKNTTSSSSSSSKSNEAFAILLIIFFFYWLFRNRGGSSGGSSSNISSGNSTRSSRRSKKY